MSTQANYYKIGLFVVLVVALLVIGLVALSAERWNKVIYFETYLDESVQGLDIGSDVVQRGVKIGRVKEIAFVPQIYPMEPGSEEFKRFSRYVAVIMAIDRRHFPEYEHNLAGFRASLQEQINRGLRFRLSYQGITGLAFMEADYVTPERNEPLRTVWVPNHIYVPSAPSLLTSFTEAVDNVFQELNRINFQEAIAKFSDTLDTIDQSVQEADIGTFSRTAVTLMEDLQETNDQLQTALTRISDPNQPGNIPSAVIAFNRTVLKAEELIGRHEYDVDQILYTLKQALKDLEDLANTLKNDPAQLIRSAPPEKSEVMQ